MSLMQPRKVKSQLTKRLTSSGALICRIWASTTPLMHLTTWLLICTWRLASPMKTQTVQSTQKDRFTSQARILWCWPIPNALISRKKRLRRLKRNQFSIGTRWRCSTLTPTEFRSKGSVISLMTTTWWECSAKDSLSQSTTSQCWRMLVMTRGLPTN